jgi:hypothetical protein
MPWAFGAKKIYAIQNSIYFYMYVCVFVQSLKSANICGDDLFSPTVGIKNRSPTKRIMYVGIEI